MNFMKFVPVFFDKKKSTCSPGGELIKLIQERYGQPYPPQLVLKMFYQTCRAVAHMHKQTPPVIHRDLKVSTSKQRNMQEQINPLKYSFFHRIVDSWNLLPYDTHIAVNVNIFKRGVKKFLSDNTLN